MSHAIYISVAEVVVDEDVIDVDIKIFSDDLLDALRNENPVLKSKLNDMDSQELGAFFDKHFHIWGDGQELDLRYTHHSIEGDSHFVHLEGLQDSSIISYGVQSSYLFDIFPTQQNIVKFSHEKGVKFFIIESKDQVEQISYVEQKR